MASALRANGSLASCSAVITVRESTPVTSMAGSELALTVTTSRFFTPGATKETSVPPPTRRVTFERESTVAPSFIKVTV